MEKNHAFMQHVFHLFFYSFVAINFLPGGWDVLNVTLNMARLVTFTDFEYVMIVIFRSLNMTAPYSIFT